MSKVPHSRQGLPGVGFAIRPSDGRLYAPFDGTIRFTFSTKQKHTLGIVSADGLETIIHVGIGTVNLRGAGFTTYCQDGQVVHAGDLLMTFDRDLIVTEWLMTMWLLLSLRNLVALQHTLKIGQQKYSMVNQQ